MRSAEQTPATALVITMVSNMSLPVASLENAPIYPLPLAEFKR
jgi:hypothetical protein